MRINHGSLSSRLALAACAILAACSGPVEKPEPSPAVEAAKVKITQFYASAGTVTRGQEVTICYGVENAETVRIEPAIRELRPSFNRCFAIAPVKTGIYRLTAAGPGGEDSAELAIQVLPPEAPRAPSLIPVFVANQTEVQKGQSVTLCYSVEGADQVSLDPPVKELEPKARCFTITPEATTTYTLRATGDGGRSEAKKLEVTVKQPQG